MKIYLFDVESYLYLGEDFCPSDHLEGEDGVTTIAPPAPVAGCIPIYAPAARQWSLVPLDSFRKPVRSP